MAGFNKFTKHYLKLNRLLYYDILVANTNANCILTF